MIPPVILAYLRRRCVVCVAPVWLAIAHIEAGVVLLHLCDSSVLVWDHCRIREACECNQSEHVTGGVAADGVSFSYGTLNIRGEKWGRM
jgi:hypothetical protein